MEEIFITKRGKNKDEGREYPDGNCTKLLYSEEKFEAFTEIMPKGTVGVFFTVPGERMEFYYILKGQIEIMNNDEVIVLGPGDSYSHHELKKNYMFRILEDLEMLGIDTTPCYDEHQDNIGHLVEILNDIQKVDGDTMEHCNRVKNITLGIAYFMKYDSEKLLDLFYAAKLHDVGKIKIPSEILLKPGRLTNEEYEIMKRHSQYTYELIREYYGEQIAQVAYQHHEMLDGTGYPRGLKGEQIGLGARIICVADAYDAMTVTRPYRKGMTQEAAIKELRRCEGTQFDGIVIDALEKYLASF